MRVAAFWDVPVLDLVRSGAPRETPVPRPRPVSSLRRRARLRLLPGWTSATSTAPIITARRMTAATAVRMSPVVVPAVPYAMS
jgi:hypothetical protein